MIMETKYLLPILALCLGGSAWASTDNVAPRAQVTASLGQETAMGINDGIMRVDGKGCWESESRETFWGEIDYPWVQLDWTEPQTISQVILYDLPDEKRNIASGVLQFSDGTHERVLQLPADGAPRVVDFEPRNVSWLRFEATDGEGESLGLSEIEVMAAPGSDGTCLSYVDPWIETTRGRYFFFVTGSMPFGMMSAAPLTRNKNQEGGGYNYNSRHVLSFPQIHGWMLSGLELMPVHHRKDIHQEISQFTGHDDWKSTFSHDAEIVQPAYHRLYLDRYHAWVEQTCAERTSLYRITYCQDGDAGLLVNLGGYVSTATMTNAHAVQENDSTICGYFDTVGRLWGGPDRVRIFFTLQTSETINSIDSYDANGLKRDRSTLEAPDLFTPRNDGMTYADAPAAGLLLHFRAEAGHQVLVKSAFSLCSLDNAKENLQSDFAGWDFDQVRQRSQAVWESYFDRIQVKGGTAQQRVKFYTDLWHSLLGRHKINDANGQYPSYFQYESLRGNGLVGAKLEVKQLPTDADGKPLHNCYNSDALWLSQWNLNNLWGLAYPEVLDDFAASFLQTGIDGGLLARGPCAGGYSFIMSGCPATTLIASAYQQGLYKKWDPEIALDLMHRNHQPGGMQGWGTGDDFDFYIANGYCPDRGGLTVQWCFEDWVLSQMAQKMDRKDLAEEYAKRSEGWKAAMHPELKLLMPRHRDGSWLHEDPLNGWGFEEANSWQTTFGLSHAIPELAEAMGGADSLCSKLNYAFEMAAPEDFVKGYGSGYVSYANQPGLSSAHVFAHAGEPWLTQKWVRRVNQQAYGATTPDLGYGGHDEDQGQMASLSALMSIGLFNLTGCTEIDPQLDVTSPVFDKVVISLNPDYYPSGEFGIVTHDNSTENFYISRLSLNDKELDRCQIPHASFAQGGTLDIWLSSTPNKSLIR